MGHRNTRGDATFGEFERTPRVVNAAARELERAGHEVHVLQREDGFDADPDFSSRDLRDVAIKETELLQRHNCDVMIDAHFQGSPDPTSGCFCIFPDAPGDTKAMNPLDVNFARRLAEEVSLQTGIRLLPISEPGFRGGMSETQTQAVQLGMFRLTVPVRQRCVRVVMEHGDTRADAAAIDRPDFFDRVAIAYVRAVDAFWPVTPVSEEFFVFEAPRTFTAHAGALGRAHASTSADIIREYQGGEAIRCIGYYESQLVAGDRRWLRAADEGAPRIHSSGVVEEIPLGTPAAPPPDQAADATTVVAEVVTEEELGRRDAARRGDDGTVLDTTTIGCGMTLAEEPAPAPD
jgi:hypothetical protein